MEVLGEGRPYSDSCMEVRDPPWGRSQKSSGWTSDGQRWIQMVAVITTREVAAAQALWVAITSRVGPLHQKGQCRQTTALPKDQAKKVGDSISSGLT